MSEPYMYGRGLRSIRTRFTLLVAVCSAVGIAAMLALSLTGQFGGPASPVGLALATLTVAASGVITFVLAGSLVANIRALKASTDAVIAGDINKPVEVDCACEVGGLADSFKRMVDRLNSNILRMNVLAYHDAITGYSNRAVVEHVLRFALDDNASPTPLAVMFMDLDGFKLVNDTFGHSAGDELLRQVATRIVVEGLGEGENSIDPYTTAYGELCNRAPSGVVFGRFAGDEFIAVLPGVTTEHELAQRAQSVQAALCRPFDVSGRTVQVGVSIGIARAPLDSASCAEILVDADMAMYAAKEQGRGRTVFFDETLRQRLVERLQLESELKMALEQDQLVVHYQPKFGTRSLEVVGYEALVRWQHPRLGLIPPSKFLDIAEQKNLMCEIGGVVLTKVIGQIHAWQQAGIGLPVAVNVSPSQFRNPELCNRIRKMLQTARIDPRQIEIEITEQVAMEDAATAGRKLEMLRELGVKLVIDDFGIGYSNLTQLVNLPFDVLKIDRSLVNDIGVSRRSEIVVESLVHLAHRMGHETVAEGVERPDQLEFLKSIGCDALQGYLLARPGPIQVAAAIAPERAPIAA